MNDWELLRSYAETRSEEAFAELVRRHVGLVYGAALRQTGGDRHLAQDVAQSVFNDLARKAGSLSARAVLSGWLYTSTRYAAAKAVRAEQRRQAREQQAYSMNDGGGSGEEANLEQLEAALDEAMHELNERDRNAILLRFFQGQNFSEVGERMGVSADGARMRVDRALEKLRGLLRKRGVASTAGGLAALLTQQTLTAAPAGLAATIASTATVSAAASGTAVAFLNLFIMSKIKTGAIALTIAGLSVPLALQYRTNQALQQKNAELAAAHSATTAEIEPLREEIAALRSAARAAQSADRSNEVYRLRAEVTRLREEVTRLREEARDASRTRAIAAAAPEDDRFGESLRSLGQRVTELKKRLSQSPEIYIPELNLITEKEWFEVAANTPELKSEDDYRRALSMLRVNGKQRFGGQMQNALRKYAEANGDAMPKSISELQGYFEQPADPAMLQRYELAHAGSYSQAPKEQDLIVEAAAPVDPEHDTRISFRRQGVTTTSYSAIGTALQQAAEAYARANSGLLPRSPEHLQGYLQQAIDPARVEKFLGQIPKSVTTLDQLKSRQ